MFDEWVPNPSSFVCLSFGFKVAPTSNVIRVTLQLLVDDDPGYPSDQYFRHRCAPGYIKQASWIASSLERIRNPSGDSNLPWWGAIDLKATTLTSRPRRPLHANESNSYDGMTQIAECRIWEEISRNHETSELVISPAGGILQRGHFCLGSLLMSCLGRVFGQSTCN